MEMHNNVPVQIVDYINLTPHKVNVYDLDGKTLLFTVPPSGTVARATQSNVLVKYHKVRNYGGVMAPVQKPTFGEVFDLPSFDEEKILLISRITGEAAIKGGRTDEDLAVPGTGVRDENGVIIGCTGVCTL